MGTTAEPPGDAARLTAVVDAHTHLFPPDVVARRDLYRRRDAWFEHLYLNPKALLVTPKTMLASMDAAGIAQAVVCGFPWRDAGLCREHNAYLAEVAAGSGGRFAWLGIVPLAEPGAAAEVERCFARGARGIGEVNADAQGFELTEPGALQDAVETCVAAGRPLMVHASEPLGHTYPGKGTATPEKLLRFVGAFPALTVVAAHWGGGLPFYELMPEVRSAAARVVYDSAASTYLYRFDVFRTVVDLVGPERVLFGSDYPVLRQDRFLAKVLGAGLREDELGPVLGGNARRVYGLPEVVSMSDGGTA